jgi:uncharacterized membrane protein
MAILGLNVDKALEVTYSWSADWAVILSSAALFNSNLLLMVIAYYLGSSIFLLSHYFIKNFNPN